MNSASLQWAGAFVQMWNGEGKMGRARGSSYSAANNVAMVMLMRVS